MWQFKKVRSARTDEIQYSRPRSPQEVENTSRELSVTEYEVTLRDYMGELAMGGYSHQWRCEVLLSAIKGYSRIWDLEVTGKGHVNRPNHVTAAKRRANKLIGKQMWFKKVEESEPNPKHQKSQKQNPKCHQNPVESVFFCNIPETQN